MKRWTFRILFLLILGVVTTVGVAWGLAWENAGYRIANSAAISDSSEYELDALWIKRLGKPARGPCTRRSGRWFGVTWAYLTDWSGPSGAGPKLTIALSGIPQRALCFHYLAFGSQATVYPEYVFDGLMVSGRVDRTLPLRPILPGFLVNTLFYAATWFCIFFGVAALRRAIRRGRGRCVKCGYDLRGQRTSDEATERRSDGGVRIGCPECGWGRET